MLDAEALLLHGCLNVVGDVLVINTTAATYDDTTIGDAATVDGSELLGCTLHVGIVSLMGSIIVLVGDDGEVAVLADGYGIDFLTVTLILT
jgi:hypothetical protein